MKKSDIIEELWDIATADATDFTYVNSEGIVVLKPIEEIPENKRKALALIKNINSKGGVEVKLYDKMKALDLLGKIIGVYSEIPQNDEENDEKLDEIMEMIGGKE